MSDTITVTCPHCRSSLVIDRAAGVVVSHEPPVDRGSKIDFDQRLQQMEQEKRRMAGRLDEAMRAEKDKNRLLEDRFRKLMDSAREDPDDDRPFVRDIDLD
jgi:hypothetical protein